ncbi:MAG: hypothetical protein ABSB70_00345 [Candidatus Velthaea sp.]
MAAFVRSGGAGVHLILAEPEKVAVHLDREDDGNTGRELAFHRREIRRRDVTVRRELEVRRVAQSGSGGLRGKLARHIRHVRQRRGSLLLHEVQRRGNRDAGILTAVELIVNE